MSESFLGQQTTQMSSRSAGGGGGGGGSQRPECPTAEESGTPSPVPDAQHSDIAPGPQLTLLAPISMLQLVPDFLLEQQELLPVPLKKRTKAVHDRFSAQQAASAAQQTRLPQTSLMVETFSKD